MVNYHNQPLVLVFSSSGDNDVSMHHGWINEVFHRGLDEFLVLLENSVNVASSL